MSHFQLFIKKIQILLVTNAWSHPISNFNLGWFFFLVNAFRKLLFELTKLLWFQHTAPIFVNRYSPESLFNMINNIKELQRIFCTPIFSS